MTRYGNVIIANDEQERSKQLFMKPTSSLKRYFPGNPTQILLEARNRDHLICERLYLFLWSLSRVGVKMHDSLFLPPFNISVEWKYALNSYPQYQRGQQYQGGRTWLPGFVGNFTEINDILRHNLNPNFLRNVCCVNVTEQSCVNVTEAASTSLMLRQRHWTKLRQRHWTKLRQRHWTKLR